MSSNLTSQSDLASPKHGLAEAQGAARNAVRGQRRILAVIARTGYAARGVVYCLVGAGAVRGALGYRVEHRGPNATHEVLLMLWRGPFGSILLCAMGAGLAAYAMWCFIRAIADPEWEGTQTRAIMRRISFFTGGLVYSALVFWVMRVLAASIGIADSPGRDPGPKHWTATLMSYPLGRYAVMGVGTGLIVYSFTQIRSVWDPRWLECDRRDLSPTAEKFVRGLGRFGFIARALVFAGIGSFCLVAALTFDARRAEGLSGTLIALRHQPAGPWLLGVVAIGLMAYGAYDLVLARYRILRLGSHGPMVDCVPSQ